MLSRIKKLRNRVINFFGSVKDKLRSIFSKNKESSQEKDSVDSMAEKPEEEKEIFYDALEEQVEEEEIFYDAEEPSSSPSITKETLTESRRGDSVRDLQTTTPSQNSSITPSLEPHPVNQAFFGKKGLWAQVPSDETWVQIPIVTAIRLVTKVVGAAREFDMVRDAKIGYQRYCKDKTQENYNNFILALNKVGKGISEFDFTNSEVNEYVKGQIQNESIDGSHITIKLPMEKGQDLSEIQKKISAEFTKQVKKEIPMLSEYSNLSLSSVSKTGNSNGLYIMSTIEINDSNASKIFLLFHLAVQKICMEETVGKCFELQKEEQLTIPKSKQRNEEDVQGEGGWVDREQNKKSQSLSVRGH